MPKDLGQETKGEFSFDLQKLNGNLERVAEKKKTSSEQSSQLGKYRKQCVDELGCHKDAFSTIERISSYSVEQRADFLRSFKPMFLGMLPQWEGEMRDMVDKAEAETKDMEEAMN